MDAASIGLLILAIVLAAIYWVCGLFIKGRIHQVVGVICIVIFLIRFATVLLSIMARLH
jgi:hypothetical protein